MSGPCFFEQNMLALSRRNPELCARLKIARPEAAGTEAGSYRFLKTASGETVPALVDGSGIARPLHSTVNPKREAERLVSGTMGGDEAGTVVFLGLGAGFAPLAALDLPVISGVLVIDYGIDAIAGLFRSCDYTGLLDDPRFTLLVDSSPAFVENAIPDLYRPAISGGIRVLPLRARTEQDKAKFGAASEAVRNGIEKVSADYSVQAHFGKRWFSNIIRNIIAIQNQAWNRNPVPGLEPGREVAICAAGPSLDTQVPLLLERMGEGGGCFVISTDTALPALMHHGLKPDAVVSIDCQHISCYHFMGSVCRGVPLFLDIASPPMLSALSGVPLFFSGGHPLAMYLGLKWMRLPVLDTSGGNVAFACLSLAESLGAGRITVCGADFSYPAGRIYARGTYVFPYFERLQNRLSTLEAQVSAFLFRSPFVPPETPPPPVGCRYETVTMRSYRHSFGQKMSELEAQVSVMPGLGIPVSGPSCIGRAGDGSKPRPTAFTTGKPMIKAGEFLEGYMRDIEALPPLGKGREAGAYMQNLDAGAGQVFTTLLPQMAALKRRQPELPHSELLDVVKRYCVDEIGRVLNADAALQRCPGLESPF